MKTSYALLTGIALLVALVSAAAAEQPLPTLMLLNNEKEVSSRTMTKKEHTLYLKMRHAMSSMAADADYAVLADNSVKMASEGILSAVKALVGDQPESSQRQHNGHDVHVEFEEMAARIDEEATQIAKFAERMAKSVQAFEAEVAQNSQDIEYSHLRIGEGDDAITLEN